MGGEKVNVFFDYTCPWVRQAGLWLIDLEEKGQIDISWKPFLLEQINSENDENWKSWDQDLKDYLSRGIWPHLGGIAARKISKDAGYKYMKAIFEDKHVNRVDVRSREYIIDLSQKIDISSEVFINTMDSKESLNIISSSHIEAEEKGIFGTPTIEFSDGNTVFLKTFTPPNDDSISFFEALKTLSTNNTYFGELKKPQPPWPKQHQV
ncbi:MAG: DsbA family selenoprotein [Chloroflexota bacterium]|nr:DsbA family selenoprotein [Chloroflexota bacterium]